MINNRRFKFGLIDDLPESAAAPPIDRLIDATRLHAAVVFLRSSARPPIDRLIDETRLRELDRSAKAHVAALKKLPSFLNLADHHLDNAAREYEQNTFGSFWDAVQNAVAALYSFGQCVRTVDVEFQAFSTSARKNLHMQKTVPALPDYSSQLPDPHATISQFKELVRGAQRSFQFALIWEYRRTELTAFSTFENWDDAIANIERAALPTAPAKDSQNNSEVPPTLAPLNGWVQLFGLFVVFSSLSAIFALVRASSAYKDDERNFWWAIFWLSITAAISNLFMAFVVGLFVEIRAVLIDIRTLLGGRRK